MQTSFVAYIDESGDEGFTFNPDGSGSSRWFVLTAAIFRRTNDAASVAALRSARDTLGWAEKKPFHFTDMKHSQRLVLLHEIARISFRTISVISYKPDIPDAEQYQSNKNLLYRYLTRILIERLSWLCRDKRRGANCVAELIFSDRAAMSYDDIRRYIQSLHSQSLAGGNINIHWPAIDMANLRAVAHSQRAGLQVADAVASSYFQAVRVNRYGLNDPSYARLLKSHVYRHNGRYLGYGVKFLSDLSELKKKMPHLGAAFEDW